MIPYRDNIPLRHTPWVTWTLIVINVVVFAYSLMLSAESLRIFQYLHGLVPARFAFPDWATQAGFPARDFTPFVSHLFMHGSWIHLVLNLWLLWIFGDNVEDRMGAVRFLAFYLVCGIASGGMHLYANPQSIIPAIGASGSIAGVMGAFFFLFPYARIVIWVLFLPLFVEVPAIAFLGIWVMIQLYNVTTGLVIDGNQYADVAWFGHLGGFIVGMLAYRLFLLPDRNDAGDSPFHEQP